MRSRRVLVTGAGGFIGRASVPELLALGYEVHAAVSPAARRVGAAEWPGVPLHAVDLLDGAAVDDLLATLAPTHLLHFAWIATPGLYWTSADNSRWLAAGQSLLKSFHRAGGVRAVMAGSCAEYDWSRVEVCNEATSPLATEGPAPLSAYASAKIAMQAALASFGREFGVSSAWGRIFFQFGPHENAARLVPSVIVNLLRGCEAPCSPGDQVRSFLHAADVGCAFAALLDSPVQGPINIGSAEPISIAALAQRIAAAIGRPELLRLGARPRSPLEPAVLLPDVGRLTRELGWRPRWSLDRGLDDTIGWWRAQLSR